MLPMGGTINIDILVFYIRTTLSCVIDNIVISLIIINNERI